MESAEQSISPVVIDHASRPRHQGPLSTFTGHARITGPCGDTMEFWVLAQHGTVEQVSFITDGCGPSLASGSMGACLAEGKPLQQAAAIGQRDILEALGGLPAEVEHCALLAANTLQAACEDAGRQTGPEARTECGSCSRSASCPTPQRLTGESDEAYAERLRLQAKLCQIGKKILVLSGKGGVGKSTVAVNLAVALAQAGWKAGLLDVDIHGPSIPTMLGLEGTTIQMAGGELLPVERDGVKVLSLGFFLQNPDDAVIWRGALKMKIIQQFLQDVAWGALDVLVVDSPPGTGDEPLSVCQLLGKVDGAVIVTTPQKVAAVDVRKSISFCRQVGVPVLGLVENMSGFVCPRCGEVTSILRSGGGSRIAADMGVPLLGSIPLDPRIAEACDDGRAYIAGYAESPLAVIMRDIVARLAAPGGIPESREAKR
jgi:ATP-binding protein involved in chromosome partitioning